MDKLVIVETVRDETGELEQVTALVVHKPVLKEFGLDVEGHEELVNFSRRLIRLDMYFIFMFISLLWNISVIQENMNNKLNGLCSLERLLWQKRGGCIERTE